MTFNIYTMPQGFSPLVLYIFSYWVIHAWCVVISDTWSRSRLSEFSITPPQNTTFHNLGNHSNNNTIHHSIRLCPTLSRHTTPVRHTFYSILHLTTTHHNMPYSIESLNITPFPNSHLHLHFTYTSMPPPHTNQTHSSKTHSPVCATHATSHDQHHTRTNTRKHTDYLQTI